MKDELRARIKELEAAQTQATVLYQVSRSLAGAPLQPREIAEIIARQFVDVLRVRECSVQLYNPQDDTMQIVFEGETLWSGEGSDVYPLANYIATRRMMETLEPVVMHASEVEAHLQEPEPGGEWTYMKEYNIATMVVIPLVVKGRAIGAIEFDVWDNERYYSEDEMHLAMTLANQAAGAMENARLHEEVQQELAERVQAEDALQKAYAEVEKRVEERSAELQQEIAERERLQQEVIEAQQQSLQELSTPVIPIMKHIIVVPLIGSIDSMRARDITRRLLAGIRAHQARVVILDITGVPLVDSGVASHLNKTIQAAKLKGARTIVTGISDAVAETIVDLGIDWSGVETLSDLQTGLVVALGGLGYRLTR